jgi:hypothetical protein
MAVTMKSIITKIGLGMRSFVLEFRAIRIGAVGLAEFWVDPPLHSSESTDAPIKYDQ